MTLECAPTSPGSQIFSFVPVAADIPQHRRGSPSRGAIFGAAAAIAAAAVAAYHNSLSGQFAFDDVPTIKENPTIRHLWDLRSVLSPPPGGYTVSGRPILNLSVAINYAFGGLNVWGYHATNLVIHILAGLTLFGIMRRTLRNTALAFATALIWTVHPLTTESVTYIIQRAESLMGLFYLLTLYCFIRSLDASAPRTAEKRDGDIASTSKAICWRCFSVTACLLGMGTKEVMVSAPVIVLLYDRTFVAGTLGEAWRRRWKYYLGLASTWILLVYLALGTGTRGGTAGMNIGGSVVNYWLTQFPAIVRYLSLVIWPRPLVLDYGAQVVQSALSVWPSILIVTALMAGTVWALTARFRNFRALGFAGIFFFAILAPTSVVPVIVQVVAEHRMYLALAPAVAVLVMGGYRLVETAVSKKGMSGSPIRFYLPLCLVGAAGLAFVTARRNEDYRTELTLWGKTAAESPDNPRAQCNLGIALSDAGNIPAAMERYRIALRIKPDYPQAHNDLGIALYDTGHWPDAIVEYQEAVRLDSGFAKAYNNLGNAFLQMGNLPEAIANYEVARRLTPDDPDFDRNLGVVLTKAGRPADAIPVYEHALQLKPDYVQVRTYLGVIFAGRGNVFLKSGKLTDAIANYEKAVQLQPKYVEALDNLGTALAQSGQVAQAAEEFMAASLLQPGNPEIHYNLGCALAQQGRTSEARVQFEEVLRLAPNDAAARANLAQLPKF